MKIFKDPRLPLLALAIITIIGSWLRLQGVFTKSFAFTYDVGRDLLAVHDMVTLGKIPLIGQTTGLPGLFYGPWWYYFLTPLFLLSSGNPQGIAFLMAVIGIFTIILGYWIGSRIIGKWFGVLFAAFLSLSPSLVGLATQIWNPNIAPFAVLLLLFFSFRIFSSVVNKKQENWRDFIAIGILLGFILDLEVVFGLLLAIGTCLSFVLLLRNNLKLKHFCLFFLGVLCMLFPRIIFELRHQFIMTNTLFSFLSKILSSPKGGGEFIIGDRIIVLTKLWNETIVSGNQLLGIILLAITVGSLVFFYKYLSKEIKFLVFSQIIILASFLIGLSFFQGDIWGHYVVGLPVIYIFIFSIAVYLLHIKYNKGKSYLLIVIMLISLFNLNLPNLYKNFKNPYWEGDSSLYRNQVAAIDYVYLQADKKPFNYAVYTPPIYAYPYQYLFLWYGKKEYGYNPSKDKASLFFLLIEPDNQYPDRLKKWLEVRDGDGKIVKEKILKGNITVQTRIH